MRLGLREAGGPVYKLRGTAGVFGLRRFHFFRAEDPRLGQRWR
jgi:hypothetical protein